MTYDATPTVPTPLRYWAFISYAHSDDKAARGLHRNLETYTGHRHLPPGPTPTGESIPRRLAPVFRDRDELGASGDLPARLHEALEASRFLIVVCSPAASRSQWVNAEIQRFKALGRSDRVLAYIVGGEPWASRTGAGEECFPSALRHIVAPDGTIGDAFAEPLAADARPLADGPRNALLKIIAGMLGVRFDDLRRRDEARRRQQRLIIAASTLAALLVLAGVVTYATWQRRNAAAQERLAAAQALVSRATDAIAKNRFDRAILLAVAASGSGETPELDLLVKTLLVAEPGLTRYFSAGEGTVTALALDATGRYAAAATNASTVTVWDLQTGQPAGPTLTGDGQEIVALCFAGGRRDRVFAITVRDTLLDWPDGKKVRATAISDGELSAAQCLPDRPLWRALGQNDTVIEVNLDAPVPTSRTMFRLNAPGSVFSTDGGYIVGVDAEAFAVSVTDLERQSTTRVKLSGRPVRINQIQVNADGSELAIMEAGSPQIHRYLTGTGFTAPFTLQPPAAVVALEFSADSSMMAISMSGGAVGVIGTNTLALRRQLRAAGGDGDDVGPVAFNRAGHILLAGASSGRVVQWDADPSTAQPADASKPFNLDEALARLCGIANRQLSGHEIRDLLDGQPPTRTCASVVHQK